jgi:hypothetical protein
LHCGILVQRMTAVGQATLAEAALTGMHWLEDCATTTRSANSSKTCSQLFSVELFAENLEGVVAQFLGIALARLGNFDDELGNRRRHGVRTVDQPKLA